MAGLNTSEAALRLPKFRLTAAWQFSDSVLWELVENRRFKSIKMTPSGPVRAPERLRPTKGGFAAAACMLERLAAPTNVIVEYRDLNLAI